MKLFISYSRQDSHWVYTLHDNLRENPLHTTWIDRDLVASVDWWDTILTNIESCDCFIFVMTPDSLQSEYCVTECEYALALNKPVLPLMLKECIGQIPEEISEIKKRQIENLSSVPPMATVLLKLEQALSQINNDRANGKYAPKRAERPLAPDDVDDASLIYQGALDDIDRKNYQRARRRLQSVADGNDGVFSEMAKTILSDFEFYIERHEMYASVKKLQRQGDRKVLNAWWIYVQKYGSAYDPDRISVMFSMFNQGKRVAMLRIEEASLVNKSELDLSELELREFPFEVTKLINLKKLDLSNNYELRKIPREIGHLTKLEVLDIGGNWLTDLPREFAQLINLIKLYLNDLELIKFPPELLNFVKLEELSLSGNELKRIPPEIVIYQNLKELFLGRNQLKTLPQEIGQLKNLEWLSLHDNNLSALPIEIGTLTNLKIFNVEDNPLTDLPQDIVQQGNHAILEWLRQQAREQGLL